MTRASIYGYLAGHRPVSAAIAVSVAPDPDVVWVEPVNDAAKKARDAGSLWFRTAHHPGRLLPSSIHAGGIHCVHGDELVNPCPDCEEL